MSERRSVFGPPFDGRFFRRLQQLRIHARRSYLSSHQGTHLSTRRGHGLEFADYRQYTPGDDFRHIDWAAFGRTERLYLRQFREEQDLNVMIIIDGSASMNYPAPPSPQNKFEVAKKLALALAYIAFSDGDTVSFSILGKHTTRKFRGTSSFGRALTELQKFQSMASEFSFLDSVRSTLAHLKTPGKCFFISDLLVEPEMTRQALDLIRARNFDLSVIQIMSPEEIQLDPAAFSNFLVDAESGEGLSVEFGQASKREYAKVLAAHLQEIEGYCRRANIPQLLVSSADPIDEIVLNQFPAVGLVRG